MGPVESAIRAEDLARRLSAEPLFHLSLASKELFHSNVLAWLITTEPTLMEAVLERSLVADPSATRGPEAEREAGNLDLIIRLPGYRPLVVENKVFSLPDSSQLDRYAQSVKAKDADLVLLSLADPGWDDDQYTTKSDNPRQWRLLRYTDLHEGLAANLGRLRGDEFQQHLIEHYISLLKMLDELHDLVAPHDAHDTVRLAREVLKPLARVRVGDAAQKLRSHVVTRMVRDEVERIPSLASGVYEIKSEFSRGTSIISAEWKLPSGDRIGFQLQGEQFRLSLIVPRGHDGHGTEESARTKREAYAMSHYKDWFSFGHDASEASPTDPVKTAHFNRYDPDFTYRYRKVPHLTIQELIALAIATLSRAQERVSPT